jgi:hypothetical protein
MEKIDRLGWTAGIAFDSFGFRMGVRVNDAAVLDRVTRLLPPGWRTATDTVVARLYSVRVAPAELRRGLRHFHLVYAGSGRVARTQDLDEAMRAMSADIDAALAQWGPGHVFVHAGVVGWKGRAILLPGRSFSGKTTLTAALVRAGCTYYSDEYAVLDQAGRVHPYTRLLGIREDGQSARATRYAVESLGGKRGVRPLPVALIIASQYQSGARWRPRCLSAGEGALALLENTVSARREPQAALATLRRVVATSAVWKGKRGEAQAVVDFIFNLLEKNAGNPVDNHQPTNV